MRSRLEWGYLVQWQGHLPHRSQPPPLFVSFSLSLSHLITFSHARTFSQLRPIGQLFWQRWSLKEQVCIQRKSCEGKPCGLLIIIRCVTICNTCRRWNSAATTRYRRQLSAGSCAKNRWWKNGEILHTGRLSIYIANSLLR